MNRRKFVWNSSLATAGVPILIFPVFGKNAPGNKMIVAVMGINGRGAFLAESTKYKTNPLETEIETCRRSKYLLPVSFRIPVLTF